MKEVNFDCLSGPTHYFGGLSFGNLASEKSKMMVSHPKKAALEGLLKMKRLYDLGFLQAILPPHPRPHYEFLYNLGFKDLKKAYEKAPEVFRTSLSSSFMWTANMATISPSLDCLDKKLHITPANLYTMPHRSLEAQLSYKILKEIFFDSVHEPIFRHELFRDEGAANHNRLTKSHDLNGLEIFVFQEKAKKFPNRQSRLSQEAIARRHQIKNSIFIEQNPKAVDAGAFHNDVVCVMNENVLFCHEDAFFNQKEALEIIKNNYINLFNEEPIIIEIKNADLSLEEAISSYLFNSQLLSKKDGTMMLFAPKEAFQSKIIEKIINDDNPITEVEYCDVGQSMGNGGGPACLRLRVLLNDEEFSKIQPEVIFNNKIFDELKIIINKFYEDDFYVEKVFNENFLSKTKEAYHAIYKILGFSDSIS